MNGPFYKERRVLVVDDDAAMRSALQASFRKQGWEVQSAYGVADALQHLERERFPLVVTDVRMPDGDGLQVMQQVRQKWPETAVIILTAFGNVPHAVQAMQGGACDYLVKPVAFEQLRMAVERVMQRASATAAAAPPHISKQPKLLGSAPVLLEVLARARQAATSGADVLIEAESGTGKELLARLIHDESSRHSAPFVAVNCAAFPESLLESELFGHVRGAFTGAIGTRPGKFEMANKGTLLLDEIGEMPLSLQPKLLRVLQEREVDRLGDARPLKVDVRIIATTNRSLEQLVETGSFRSDLFYRLNVIPLSLPPLRERREDVAELAAHFLQSFAAPPVPNMSAGFVTGLQRHSWPGNVRELVNFMRRVAALCRGKEIGVEFLDFHARAKTTSPEMMGAGLSMRDAERKLLELTLVATDGNRTRAAEMLGISLRTIRNKIRDYQLPPRSYA